MPEAKTKFAPAERASLDVVKDQKETVTGNPRMGDFLDRLAERFMVLNEYRQIVFSNRPMSQTQDTRDSAGSLGKRPGEAISCVNSAIEPGGCGTSHACKVCGALTAILAAQAGNPGRQECRIRVKEGDVESWLELEVWASPFYLDEDNYVCLAINDLSERKRRETLERIFFHDILNLAGGIQGGLSLLLDDPNGTDRETLHLLHEAARQLEREISDQRDLAAAERGELTVAVAELQAGAFLHRVRKTYEGHLAGEGVEIVLDFPPGETIFSSDPTILGRVIGNMIKNAMEASGPGQRVTMGYAIPEQGGIEFWVHNPTVMPSEVQVQVFQRSFSTKGAGRGLGTYSIRLLTDRYLGGTSSFSSSPETGTIFRVRLPEVLNRATH